jgi:hypothetical protein
MKSTQYYTYNVFGTPKKGRIPKYKVKLRVNHDKNERVLVSCDCKAREFRPYAPCKHMKLINERLGHSL